MGNKTDKLIVLSLLTQSKGRLPFSLCPLSRRGLDGPVHTFPPYTPHMHTHSQTDYVYPQVGQPECHDELSLSQWDTQVHDPSVSSDVDDRVQPLVRQTSLPTIQRPVPSLKTDIERGRVTPP